MLFSRVTKSLELGANRLSPIILIGHGQTVRVISCAMEQLPRHRVTRLWYRCCLAAGASILFFRSIHRVLRGSWDARFQSALSPVRESSCHAGTPRHTRLQRNESGREK